MDTESVKRPWWADDIRDAWKWFQVQAGAVVGAAPIVYDQLDMLKGLLSAESMMKVMSLLGWLIMLNAVRNKAPKDSDANKSA